MSELNPITREELFLAKAAGAEVPALTPITRIERFLQNLIDHIKSIGTGGGGGATPDWNAAEGEPGHVLNRTHYTGFSDNVIFPETTVSWTANDSQPPMLELSEQLVAGNKYKIIYDGAESISECINCNGVLVIGNHGLLGSDFEDMDTGQPFAVGYMDGMGNVFMHECMFAESPVDGSATLKIIAETVNKIPDKYYDRSFFVDFYTEDGVNCTATATAESVMEAINRGLAVFGRITEPTGYTSILPLIGFGVAGYTTVFFFSAYDIDGSGMLYTNSSKNAPLAGEFNKVSYVREDGLNEKIDDRLKELGLINE